jgi:tetratricopeptide (TPR) repeat protein
MKCLEKDRNRRYESASALAADLQRYLADEPVQACPPSAGYRLRKFTRRNRQVLVMAGLFAGVLVVAAAVSAWQAVVAREAQYQAEADRKQAEADRDRAKNAEGRAVTEAAIARAVNAFLQEDLLTQTASGPPSDREFDESPYLTVKEALDRAAAQIGKRFRDQPLVEAAIRMAIAQGYSNVAQRKRALPHFEKALELRRDHLGWDNSDTLYSLFCVADTYSWNGRHAEALVLYQQILDYRKARYGPDHLETLNAIRALARGYGNLKKWETSVLLHKQVLAKLEINYGPSHSSTFGTMGDLALTYNEMGRFTESMDLYERLWKAGKMPNMPYAVVCLRAGKLERAEQLLNERLEHVQKLERSFRYRRIRADAFGYLALNMYLKHKYIEAESLLQKAIAFYEKERPDYPRTFYWKNLLGAIFLGQHRTAEAEPLLLQGYAGVKQREATNLDSPWLLAEAGERVVLFYEATNQPEKLRAWREKLKAGESGAGSPSVK